jgi:hypothetical protein
MPTITDTPPPLHRPWRVDSLVYPAFFGGPLAATYLGAVNARRLGVSGRHVALILAAGAAALIAMVLVTVLVLADASTGAQRITFSIAGVAVWGVIQLVQRRPFRVFLLRGGEPASLWAVGIAVTVGSILLQGLLLSLANTVVD